MKLLGALLVIVPALAAAACGGGGAEGYSPEVKGNFMDECVEGAVDASGGAAIEAATQEYCSCTYDELAASVPYEEFAEGEERAPEDEDVPLPPEYEAAVAKCRAEQGYSEGTRAVFVATCVKSAVDQQLTEAEAQDYCRCAFAELKAKIPYTEFDRYDAQARRDPSAELPPKLAAVFEHCAGSLG